MAKVQGVRLWRSINSDGMCGVIATAGLPGPRHARIIGVSGMYAVKLLPNARECMATAFREAAAMAKRPAREMPLKYVANVWLVPLDRTGRTNGKSTLAIFIHADTFIVKLNGRSIRRALLQPSQSKAFAHAFDGATERRAA